MAKVKRDLTLAGFRPEVTWNDREVLHTGWVRVAGILHEAGLSALPDQKLAIKVEIDTRPPDGARCERRVVTRHVSFLLQYYDLPSLLAGKLHAAITRDYAKGRDWYDLVWYLSQQPPVEPNLALLQNALDQTRGAVAAPRPPGAGCCETGLGPWIWMRSAMMSTRSWNDPGMRNF